MTRALLAACALLVSALGWALWSREMAVNALTETRSELAACAGRVSDIREDLLRDMEIDALPDSALRSVPDAWMRDAGAD